MLEAKVLGSILVGLIIISAIGEAGAAAVYRCKSKHGAVVFKQSPCELKNPADKSRAMNAPKKGPVQRSATGAMLLDGGIFDSLPDAEAEIIKIVGNPAAHYSYKGTGHWFYPNAVKTIKGENYSPELLFKEGLNYQINWLPENMVNRSVNAAQRISGWSEPGAIQEKPFTLQATGVEGKNKSEVLRELGEPDAKQVVAGSEVWEYDLVPLSSGNPKTLSIVIEFDGDKVIRSREK